MPSSRELAILVTARNMASGVLKGVRGDIRSIQDEAKRGLKNTARNLTFIGGAAAAGMTALVVQSVKDASQLEQATGAIESVFGESAAAIEAWADRAAEAAGLSRREVKEMAAILGAQLQGMGFAADEAADMVINLEQRGADLAATFGGTTAEAVDAISSLLRGERDPIEKYGVSLKQADINARLAAEGLDDLEGEARKQAEAQAALDLLMQQTNRTQGQFTRETDTMAGAQQRLRANLENTRATIGQALLPQIAALTEKLNDAVIDHLPQIEQFASELPGIFDDLLGIVENLPWDAIGTTFSLMGQGAKTALSLFADMPPWVQTAVITGWGLNKLSGGALGNIVGQLGSGLIKGVLGMNAGVVNINAGMVNGGGGLPGAAGGGKGLMGKLGRVAGIGLAVGGGALIGGQVGSILNETVGGVGEARSAALSSIKAVLDSGDVNRIEDAIEVVQDALNPDDFAESIALGLDVNGVRSTLEEQLGALQAAHADAVTASDAAKVALLANADTMRNEGDMSRAAIDRVRATQEQTRQSAERQRLDAAAADASMLGTLAQIRDKATKIDVTVNTTVNVSAAQVQNQIASYRKSSGSGGFI